LDDGEAVLYDCEVSRFPGKTNTNANLTLQAWALVVTEGGQDFRLYQLEKAHLLGSMKMEQSRSIHLH
jgi:hypothetical protein